MKYLVICCLFLFKSFTFDLLICSSSESAYASNEWTNSNQSKISEHLDSETYILRCWNGSPVLNAVKGGPVGHISLETENYYLGFWPKNYMLASKYNRTVEGKFCNGYRFEYKAEGSKNCDRFKLVRCPKGVIDKINQECQRLGAYNKKTNCVEPGIKKYWTMFVKEHEDNDCDYGNCASTVQQCLDKGGVPSTKKQWLEAGALVGGSALYAWAGGEAALAATAFVNPTVAFSVYCVGNLCCVAGTIYRFQMNSHGLRLTNSAIEKKLSLGSHNVSPEKLYAIEYPEQKVEFDNSKQKYGSWTKSYKKRNRT